MFNEEYINIVIRQTGHFNFFRSVCDYAKTKFPRNVECRTGHSLGFQHVGRRQVYNKTLFMNN